jgi:RimJ/RimL family protein N-acetyltransferase
VKEGIMTIRLVSVNVTDAERMVAALEPDATRNLKFFSAPVSIERQRAYLEKVMRNPAERLWGVEADGTLVGTVGLHEIDEHLRTARLGLLVFRKDDRGKGHGKAAIRAALAVAFDPTQLDLNKVYLNVFAENVRSRTMYAKMGFVQEGVLRQEYLLDGAYHDMVRMSMLRSEWSALSE